jgi:hypothetical protein
MADHPRVQGVYTAQGSDWSDLINNAAEAHGLPPRVLLATAIAECGLDETCEPQVTRGMARYFPWPDVSHGPCHQAVAFSPYGSRQNTAANIERHRQKFCGDLPYAFGVAAANLAGWWGKYAPDGAECLGRYNWPARGLQGNPNAAHIKRAWERSAAYVVTEDAPASAWQPDDVRHLFPFEGCTLRERALSSITEVVYHHGASRTPAATRDAELGVLAEYHALHVRQGWCVIAYHLAVGPSGTVYWLNGLHLISYHALQANPHTVGIVFLGNYAQAVPPPLMLDAARRARGWVARQVGRDDLLFSGHQDHVPTGCPGGWWPSQRHLLDGLPAENGDDDMERVRELEAKLAGWQEWWDGLRPTARSWAHALDATRGDREDDGWDQVRAVSAQLHEHFKEEGE